MLAGPEAPSAADMTAQLFLGSAGRRKRQELAKAQRGRRRRPDRRPSWRSTCSLVDDEPIVDVPLLERKRILEGVLDESELVRRTAFVRPPVDPWLGTWRSIGFTELAYKAANSRYRPGEPNPDWATVAIPPALTAPSGRWYGDAVPETVLSPAIRDQIDRLGRADIMVGIPSYRNAATIGHVVRAAQAGLVQYFPDLRPVLVNADAGSPDGTQRVGRRDRAAGLRRADPARPPDEPARARRPDLSRGRRDRRQGGRPADDLRDGRRARRQGAGRRRLRPALDRARVDRAAVRPHPQGRLRLRGPALQPLQVRRHDHEHRHLPAHPGALRAPDPAADRRRLRRLGRPRPALPHARRLGRGHLASSGSTSG